MRWMTRAANVLLAGVLMLPLMSPAQARATEARAIQVFVNGQSLSFDVPPALVDGRTLVPLRRIFESLGAEVTWDDATKTAMARWSGGELSLQLGASSAQVSGQAKPLDVPGQLIGGRTMVPLRFVGETLGAQVGWYGKSRSITINKASQPLTSATVTRVVDGDTVDVQLADGTIERVRLTGVDTPETVHPTKGTQPGGPEASAFTKERLSGQKVQLETDVQARDKYGRRLSYLYLANGTLFNAMLVDEGYARMATFPPNVRYVEVYRSLQADAQGSGVGLWQSGTPAVPDPTDQAATEGSFVPDPAGNCGGKIKGNKSSSGELIYHTAGGAFYERTKAEACFATDADAQAAGYRASKR